MRRRGRRILRGGSRSVPGCTGISAGFPGRFLESSLRFSRGWRRESRRGFASKSMNRERQRAPTYGLDGLHGLVGLHHWGFSGEGPPTLSLLGPILGSVSHKSVVVEGAPPGADLLAMAGSDLSLALPMARFAVVAGPRSRSWANDWRALHGERWKWDMPVDRCRRSCLRQWNAGGSPELCHGGSQGGVAGRAVENAGSAEPAGRRAIASRAGSARSAAIGSRGGADSGLGETKRSISGSRDRLGGGARFGRLLPASAMRRGLAPLARGQRTSGALESGPAMHRAGVVSTDLQWFDWN